VSETVGDVKRDKLADQLALVNEFAGSDCHTEFIRLLHLLDECYDDDFRMTKPESLGYYQGASQQVRLLKSVLLDGRTGVLPKL
jgi:hypothetical protein